MQAQPSVKKRNQKRIRVDFERTSFLERMKIKFLSGSFFTKIIWSFFRLVLLLGISYVILFPFFSKISASFMSSADMNDVTVRLIPKYPTLDTYKTIISNSGYFTALFNTFVLSALCGVVQTLVCSFVGYGFAKFKFRGSKILFLLVILTLVIPHQTLQLSMYMQFRYFDIFGLLDALTGSSMNLTNTNFAMYIPALFCNGIRAGLFIYLFRQFFRGLPKELEDAAYLDGCGPFKTFISVMVPNAASSFLTVFIFSIVWYWNDYYVSSMYFKDPNTIAMKINSIAEIMALKLTGKVGVASDYIVWMEAGCLLAIAPIVIMYIFLQKYFTEGIERAGLAN